MANTASDEELAASAGFTVAFFKSSDELWGVFKKARKEQWTGDRLLSRLRNTSWFKKNSESERQNKLLKESDPAEYRRRRSESEGNVEAAARSLGLTLGSSTLKTLTGLAFNGGWSSAQIENYLRNTSAYRKRSESQREINRLKDENPAEFRNRLGKAEAEITSVARNLGLSLSSSQRNSIANRALLNNWSASQIENHLRGTSEFKQRSESQREIERLKRENPAEYRNRYSKVRAEVQRISRETGLAQSARWINETASRALTGNWTETQIQNYLAGFGNVADRVREGKGLTGDAAAARRLVQQLSQDYGINMSKGTMANMVQKMAGGVWDENFAQDWFMRKAKRQYRNLAEDIDAGLTVRQVAEPYVESMSEILELNPRSIDVFDRDVRAALRGKDDVEDLADFENRMRNDPRWNRTHNARESMMTTGRDVLAKMKLMS